MILMELVQYVSGIKVPSNKGNVLASFKVIKKLPYLLCLGHYNRVLNLAKVANVSDRCIVCHQLQVLA